MVSGKTFDNRWAVLSYSQTGEMRRKLGQPLVCTRHLSAIGYRQPGCKFTHECDRDKITLAEIQKYPVQEAFLVGHWGGPTALPNEVRFPAEASNFEKTKKELRAFCDDKLKDHAELEAETESDDDTVDGHGIRSADEGMLI